MSSNLAIKIRREITTRSIDVLKPAHRNPRTHSRKQLRQIADSIERFGFTNPVLVDDDDQILAGHGRVAAARMLGMGQVPVVCVGDLSPEERKAYALADNKIALNAGWDQDLLALELKDLLEGDFEIELTGFSLAEIDFTLDAVSNADPNGSDAIADRIPEMASTAVSCRGEGLTRGTGRPVTCAHCWRNCADDNVASAARSSSRDAAIRQAPGSSSRSCRPACGAQPYALSCADRSGPPG